MKITYLCPLHHVKMKMSRVRFHQIKAISALCDVIWTGIGWDNYDDSKSVQDNLLSIYNGHLPDLIIGFDHRNLIEFNKTTVSKCVMMNEMHGPDGDRASALDICKMYDFVICHHLNEMLNPYFDEVRHKCYNIPHCADKGIFKDYGLPKTTDVLLCGSLVLEKYKLRRRFIGIIDKLKSLGVNAKIHQHPGGYLTDAHTDRYLVDFAKAINSSKICLTCSSIYKCAFAKYVEIPLCNSILAGDLPDERQDFFSSFMIVIKDEDEDTIIIDKLINHLNDQELCKKGLDLNQSFGINAYAKQFVALAGRFAKKKLFI